MSKETKLFGLNITGMILAGTLVLAGISGWYYVTSQNKIDTLVKNNVLLGSSVETQKETIVAIQEQYKKQTEALVTLAKDNSTLTLEKEALSDKLMKHDLEELSRRKPALVEKRINDGTKELFNSFNSITTK